jgi:hypothetical protein
VLATSIGGSNTEKSVQEFKKSDLLSIRRATSYHHNRSRKYGLTRGVVTQSRLALRLQTPELHASAGP